MIKIENKERCCGCSACANICPKNCISMEEDNEGFIYPVVDLKSCINCKLCEKVCPNKKNTPTRKSKPITYAAKINDDEIRNQSSSGGIFSILAEAVLNENGVVYGVAMSDDLKSAHHIRVDSIDDMYKLRGSKYLQASVGDMYRSVKEDLKNGKKVLFSGAPCQINGLKLFLEKDYEKLITIEVICHGTPSPALWKKYCEHIENKYNGQIKTVNFREKRNGWKKFGLVEEGNNISQYLSLSDDPYMIMFLRDYCLRPSCYDCNAKKLESMADLTIADFWGINNVAPEMDDDKGTSLVLVQTEKGNVLLNTLKDKFIGKKVDYEESIIYNKSYFQSVNKPKERKTFFSDMNNISFDELKNKYCKKDRFTKRVINKAKRIIKTIIRRGGVKISKFEYGLLITIKK